MMKLQVTASSAILRFSASIWVFTTEWLHASCPAENVQAQVCIGSELVHWYCCSVE